MEKWKEAVYHFLERYENEDYYEGAIVCGSYVSGNNNEFSDIDVHIVLERAKLYENDNNYRAAEIDYLEYLNKFPTDKFVIDSYTAMTCRYKGKEFAITTLENFYRKIPKEQLYYCALANIYSEANEYDNAIMLINKAINLCPDDDEKAYFYSQRALIHLKNNNTELYEQDIKLRDACLDEVFKNLST